MNIFVHPWALLLIPLVWMVAGLWLRMQKKRAYLYSDERVLAELPQWVKILLRLAEACLFLSLTLAVIALARPLGEMQDTSTFVFMHRGCLVVDTSDSMNMIDNAESGISKIITVVNAGNEFVMKRKGSQGSSLGVRGL